MGCGARTGLDDLWAPTRGADASVTPSATPDPGCGPAPTIQGDLKPLWARAIGAGTIGGVATDASGNVVVGGSMLGPITFGSTVLPYPDAGSLDVPLLFELDPSGNLVWSTSFSGTGRIAALGLDAAGNIYVAADPGPRPTLDFGTGQISGSTLLAKLDPTGHALWAKGFGTTAFPFALAVDAAGEVAVLAYADSGALPGMDDTLLSVFDPSGNLQYSKPYDGNPYFTTTTASEIAFDPAGNLFVAGSFQGTLDLGSTLTAPSPWTAFAAKLGPQGEVLWQVADGTYTNQTAIAATSAGPFLAGSFKGTAGIAAPLAASGSDDLFLAAFDEDGHPQFEKTIPSTQTSFNAAAADPAGGVFAAGVTSDFVDLGGGVLAPPGVLLAKFDATGQLVTSAVFGTDPFADPTPTPVYVTVDHSEDVVLGLSSTDTIDLGTGTLATATTTNGSPTIFLAKYAQQPAPAFAPRTACAPPPGDAGPPADASSIGLTMNTISDVALTAKAVYWTTGGDVMSAPLDGGTAVPVAVAQNVPGAMAIDSQSLYWVNVGSVYYPVDPVESPGHNGSIVSVPLAGGTPRVLASDQDSPLAIAVDDTAIYWTAGGVTTIDGGTSDGVVLSMPLGGGTPTLLVSGLGMPTAIAVHEGVVAFAAYTSSASAIGTVPSTGGTSTTLATGPTPTTSIALDGTNVYWVQASSQTVGSDGRILSMPLAGGTPLVLADRRPDPGKMVLLGSTLFWSEPGFGPQPDSSGGVWSVPADGGAPLPLQAPLVGAGPFAIDGAHLAFSYLVDPTLDLTGILVQSR
jgi:hypothetical protein